MDMKTLESIIRNNPWLSAYMDRMPDILKQRLEVMEPSEGKVIIRKGFEHSYIYFLVTGSLVIQNEYYNGRSFSYAEQQSPGFCGLLEFFSGQLLPTSTIRAGKGTILIRMGHSDFSAWVENDFAAYRMCTVQFARQMYPTLANQCVISAYSKKRLFINQIVDRFGDEIRRAGTYRIPVKREELALVLGTSVRTIYRIEEELRDSGYISLDRRKIAISRDQLRMMEEFQSSDEG